VFGICLGLQLFCRYSEEGDTACLGIFDTDVKRFSGQNGALKVPHMGWNTLDNPHGVLFEGLEPEPYVYFVHSYYAEPCEQTAAACRYGETFSAALQHRNFYAVQFHPERSGDTGRRILQQFINLY
jgi:glutamine amidotransferase